MFYINSPLEWRIITQPFGGTNKFIDYTKFGLKAHDAIDFRAVNNTPLFAVFDGKVKSVGKDSFGGKYVKIWTDDIDGFRYCVLYYHINKSLVKKGEQVKEGQHIALSGNTGKYTTSAHLHFKLSRYKYKKGLWRIDKYNNGYKGGINPQPFFKDGLVERLPVDVRYNRKQDWLAEFKMRFKTPFLHRYLKKIGREPLSLQQREMIALVYGGWSTQEVFNFSMYPLWTTLKKEQYNNGIKPPIRV